MHSRTLLFTIALACLVPVACVSDGDPEESGSPPPATAADAEPSGAEPAAASEPAVAPDAGLSHARSSVPDDVRERVGGVEDPRVRALIEATRAWRASGGPPTAAQLGAAPVLAPGATPWLYDAPHLLVLLPTPEDRAAWQRADERLARAARLLRAVRERVDEVFGGNASQWSVHSLDGALPVFLVPDADALAAWRSAFEGAKGYPAQADYLESAQALVVIDGGPAASRLQLELPTEGGRVQRAGDQVVAHEATHQLVAALRHASVGGDAALPFWLDEGLAEFVGGIEADADTIDELPVGSVGHGRVHLERVRTARALRRSGIGRWPLDELVRPGGMGELMRAGDARSPGLAPHGANRWFYDSWALVHFLWNYDGGRRREGFRRYLGDVIGGGDGGVEALRPALGASGAAEWEQLSAELDFYSDLLLRRVAGRRKGDPSRWYRPSTDPPTEVFDPDAADRDYDE